MDKAVREQQLRKSIELSPIACIISDPERHDNPIVAVNRAFLDLTGYGAGEVIGRNCRLLQGAETEAAARDILRQAVASGGSAVVEITNYKRDGRPFRNA